MDEYRPKLMQAETARERMDALCEFLEFWLGPRRPEYGEAPEALNGRPLPMPLRRLYGFAGRWPSEKARAPIDYEVPALSHEDCLSPFHKLHDLEDGRISFASDERGLGDYRTLASGDDPPVWYHAEYFNRPGIPEDLQHLEPSEALDRLENLAGPEQLVRYENLVSDSLSRFLVTFALRQLPRGSRLYLVDDTLGAAFASERDAVHLIWTDALGPDGDLHEFHLWRGALVARDRYQVAFAANHPEGIRFLIENQGPIDEIRLIVDPWGLTIHPDGSARLKNWLKGAEASADAPAGTFDFPALLATVAARASASGDLKRHASMYLPRRGQSFMHERYIDDRDLITSLFQSALSKADGPTEALERRFEDGWPL